MTNKNMVDKIFTIYGICFRWFLNEGRYHFAADKLFREMELRDEARSRIVYYIL